ncbi:unnamed protein product [Linum trigynum]|uniref:MATH domain-containing protein n=1 Tax=Linum trigynum TaxID=586398 RepID=A0AAV2EVF1_9ROSI
MDAIRVRDSDLANKPSSSTSQSPLSVTTSTSRNETINGSHEFDISGYSLSKGMGVGKYIASETFFVGGYAWAIYFYPDRRIAESRIDPMSPAAANEAADDLGFCF